MNKGLLAFNVVILIAVCVLFYLYFNKSGGTDSGSGDVSSAENSSKSDFRVAYFDMDSIEANFTLFKQMQKEVGKKEDSMNAVLNSAKMNFQNKYLKYQDQQKTMTQEQLEDASRELSQLDIEIKNKETGLNQNFQSFYMNKQQEVIQMIKKYCKEFNKDGKYTYIIANEPGLVYYKDTAYNITSELIKGLNEYYNKQKKN